jgi:transposase-like protein
MHWPKSAVEHRTTFQPPFCPWPSCTEHRRPTPGYRCWRHGSFSTARRKKVPRFRCPRCRRTFSRQTFAVSYYRKRPELLPHVAAGLVAGSAFRQLARSLGCAPNTVASVAARLGRHAMLLQQRSLDRLRGRLSEPVVFDHFETFEFTQDYPFGVGTAVGADSWFVYCLDPAPHGRSGRRSRAQARRLRSRPRRSVHGRYLGSTRRVLETLLPLRPPGGALQLRWDGHADYLRAAARLPGTPPLCIQRFPNPRRSGKGTRRSRAAVLRDQAMFAVDLVHKILRHSLAHHRRETIAFARRINAAMERMALAAIWRNFVKPRSERRPRSPTPAMQLGLTDARWSWGRVLARRLFFHRSRLAEPWPELYRRIWTTPLIDRNAVHEAVRAF